VWYVEIKDKSEAGLYSVFTFDDVEAKRFYDAVSIMMDKNRSPAEQLF